MIRNQWYFRQSDFHFRIFNHVFIYSFLLDEEEEEYDDDEEYDDTAHQEAFAQSEKTSYDDARQWWSNLSPEMKAQLAKEEHVKNEADKRFQIYLKALLIEAEKLGWT